VLVADNDEGRQVAAGVELRDLLRDARRRQVTAGVELRHLLSRAFRPQVTEGVEPECSQHIKADEEIVKILRSASFCGPAWREFAEELVRYGLPVMIYWLVTGRIFVMCQARGFGLERPECNDWARADLEGFADEVVARGLNTFKQALQDGEWHSDGGATLRTFFMGACVLEFPNLYRKWWSNADSRWLKFAVLAPCIVVSSSLPLDSGELVAMRIAIQEALKNIVDERTRTAVILQSEGYSYREIGKSLGITPPEVKALLRRHRENWWNRSRWERGGENDG
jgi:hypothetical protein